MIPSYQPCNKQTSRGGNFLPAAGGFRSPSPGFFKTSFISSASKVRLLLLAVSHMNMNKCILSCHVFGKNNTRRRHLAKCSCMSKISDKQTSLEFKMSLKPQREDAVIWFLISALNIFAQHLTSAQLGNPSLLFIPKNIVNVLSGSCFWFLGLQSN